jgi:CRP/FNR family transcriptional regulator, cyclic AMP receptor protein
MSEAQRHPEPVLTSLPGSTTREYRNGAAIYGPLDVRSNVHIVLKGVVAVSWAGVSEEEPLLEIFGPEELFGEGAFLDAPRVSGRAVALGDVTVMSWPAAAIAEIVQEHPRAGLALVAALVRRNAGHAARIESFSRDTFEGRLARLLMRLAELLGRPDGEGWLRLIPLTQAFLAGYLGVSREVVTLHMNRFRRKEWVTYSRESLRLQPALLRQVYEASATAAPSPLADRIAGGC